MSKILNKSAVKVLVFYIMLLFVMFFVVFIFEYGLGNFLVGLTSLFKGNSLANPLEGNFDGIFALGILLIYMSNGHYFGEKYKLSRIILLFIFLLLCGKRSQFLALILLVIFSMITGFVSPKRIHFIQNVVSICMIGSYYTLLYLIKSEKLSLFLFTHNINTMGRIKMWEYITPYYDFSFKYFGHGYNFSSMTILSNKVVGYSDIFYAWHGVAISFFVDMGFIMFGFWLFYNLLYLPKIFRKNFGHHFSNLFWTLTVYLFVLYITESVINSVCTQAMYIVILTHALSRLEDKQNREKN